MKGQEVFRQAVVKLAAVVEEALAANGLSHADIDWLVPHQANRRIIDAMGKRLKIAAGSRSGDCRSPRQHVGGQHSPGTRRGGA
ncbi:MAG: 3-oxoacyl-[acyl-carrier-protein] synthase III C-terminal domain-containing protein [Rhodospirillales bacterium]